MGNPNPGIGTKHLEGDIFYLRSHSGARVFFRMRGPNIEILGIENIKNDNIDIFVELENGWTYTMVVATPLNLLSLMKKDSKDFLNPSGPFIIVSKLTKDIIDRAIKEYAQNDAYWLKVYYLSTEFDIATLDKIDKAIREEYDDDE